jgi:ATP-dependent Clp protease protease subunit
VDDGLAIYDIIRYVKMPLRTHSAAGAMGMAALIVATGTPGSRTANPAAQFGLGRLSASLNAPPSPEPEIERMRDILSKLYRQCTRMTGDQIREAWENDSHFSAAAAVELGFIDRIVDGVEGSGS